jgi:hypothetical protein
MTQDEIRKIPHKVIDGIAIALTQEELNFHTAAQPESEILEQMKIEKLAKCQKFLESTDWQAAAFIKYDRPIDANVSENCLKAKQWKIDIAACTSLEQLNAININFQ